MRMQCIEQRKFARAMIHGDAEVGISMVGIAAFHWSVWSR